ncbi:MAG: UDP-N-acetylglucosamine 1-carboxyvinyltransferase [Capsulimonadaceae bacterium]
MNNLLIRGGKPLSGLIKPSGNKNAILPILCATLLTRHTVTIHNVPDITDVGHLLEFFRTIGSEVSFDKETQIVEITHSNLTRVDNELPGGMRSALLLLAPLLMRCGQVSLFDRSQGCTLGIREIDPHIEILRGFGATVEKVVPLNLALRDRFEGDQYWADYASVTATEQFVLAAVLARGKSSIINAACEPHVQDLCTFLVSLGARIHGIGTGVLHIDGVDELSGGSVTISPDHHEIATFLAIGAMTGGEVRVENSIPHHFPLINRVFSKFGVQIDYEDGHSIVRAGQPLVIKKPYTPSVSTKIEGAPWPYFPVDLLPPMVALAVRSEGSVLIWNKVYEGAFGWVSELQKFGANVLLCDPHRLIVFGTPRLLPSEVETPYIIRVAVALYMVASSIDGESVVRNARSIRRAHPRFVENLKNLGASVEWV